MQGIAHGTFQVTMVPRAAGDSPAPLGRYLLSKRFEGGLQGESAGEMLSAGDPASGSAGYVALEWVDGRIGERAGRFALQHAGTMDRGRDSLQISVVPGSGTGALVGISGRLELRIVDGRHDFSLHYELPES